MSTEEDMTTCQRCLIGIDDDGDGNCALCARWDDAEAARVRGYAIRRLGASPKPRVSQPSPRLKALLEEARTRRKND